MSTQGRPLLLPALPLLVACTGPKDEAPRACNGHAELCGRRLDEVALPATHNSMSSASDGWSLPNQGPGIPDQLADGVRGFLIDTHEEDGALMLCHEYCSLGSIPLDEALGFYADFLEANPDEVLVFILQDAITAEQTEGAFEDAGLADQAWTWDGGAMPTLGELIAADTRLVVSAEASGPPPDWYHHAWDLFWDTPYDFSAADEFNCDLNRGAITNPLFLVNHWLGPLPTEEAAAEVNATDVLGARVASCAAEAGRLPTLVAVDHYELGDLFDVVDGLNGV